MKALNLSLLKMTAHGKKLTAFLLLTLVATANSSGQTAITNIFDLPGQNCSEFNRKAPFQTDSYKSRHDSNTTLIGCWAYGPCWAVDAVNNLACFGNGGYLEIIDISLPTNPDKMGKICLPATAEGITMSGIYAYVADGFYGLCIT